MFRAIHFPGRPCGLPYGRRRNMRRGGIGLMGDRNEKRHREVPPLKAACVLRWQRWCRAGLRGLLDVCDGTATPLGPCQGRTGQA
jgi:hypothetical protein